MKDSKLKIFTWHVHGTYLYYLTQVNCDFYIPFKNGRPAGYGGKIGPFPWGNNLYEIPVDKIKEMDFDIILFQNKEHYLKDQYEILSPLQRKLPKIYLEHDTPRENPTDTVHVVKDPAIVVVHVTHFNRLMWNNGITPTVVIEHGVHLPKKVMYKGEKERGIVVINNLASRGRRLGVDIYEYVKTQVPLDVVGINSESVGGLGEVPYYQLTEYISSYRFFFNPIRYTSLGLAVLEAMMVGLPIVGLATTELVTVIKNGENGFIDTNVDNLIKKMRFLLDYPEIAKRMGENAKKYAQKRFNIKRFIFEWEQLFEKVVNKTIAVDTFSEEKIKQIYQTEGVW